MEYTVSLLGSVDFAPESAAAEIVQNVRCILSTAAGTVPLDRAFGTDWSMVDRPLPVAKALFIAEVADAVRKYEPRAVLRGVEFEDSAADAMDGVLRPRVMIDIDESMGIVPAAGSAGASAEAEDASVASAGQSLSAASVQAEGLAAAISTVQERVSTALAMTDSLDSRLHEIESTDYSAVMDGRA